MAETAKSAFEVRASYGGSLLASRRVGGTHKDARGHRRLGAVLVALGVVAIAVELRLAHTWIKLPVDGAVAGLACLLVGFVVASIGWHRGAEPDAARFRIGEDPSSDVTVAVPGLSATEHLDVVARGPHGFSLAVLPTMTGVLRREGRAYAFEALVDEASLPVGNDGRFSIPLTAEDEAELTCGELTLSISPSTEADATARAPWVDPRLLVATLLATVLVGGTIYLAGHFVPDSQTLPDQEDRPVVYER
mgnify:CR=1 FL=1